MAQSNQINGFEFNLKLSDVIKSLSFYHTDDEGGDKQLRFDPPVYQARYSAINAILTMKQWIPHIKKVLRKSNATFEAIRIGIVIVSFNNFPLSLLLNTDRNLYK